MTSLLPTMPQCQICGSVTTSHNVTLHDEEEAKPTFDDNNTLRDVDLDGFRLTLGDTYQTDSMGKSILFYRMLDKKGATLFEGADFHCSPRQCIDSDETLRSLIGFLTLRPGDTDKEYFDSYTPVQLAFCSSDAEALSMWSMEADGEYPAMEFVNLDGFGEE